MFVKYLSNVRLSVDNWSRMHHLTVIVVISPAYAASTCTQMLSAAPTSAISSKRSNEQQLVVPKVATTKNGISPAARSFFMVSRSVSPRSLCSLSVSKARSNTPPSSPARSTDEWDSADEYATNFGTISLSNSSGFDFFMISSMRALAPSSATRVASLAVPYNNNYNITIFAFQISKCNN